MLIILGARGGERGFEFFSGSLPPLVPGRSSDAARFSSVRLLVLQVALWSFCGQAMLLGTSCVNVRVHSDLSYRQAGGGASPTIIRQSAARSPAPSTRPLAHSPTRPLAHSSLANRTTTESARTINTSYFTAQVESLLLPPCREITRASTEDTIEPTAFPSEALSRARRILGPGQSGPP